MGDNGETEKQRREKKGVEEKEREDDNQLSQITGSLSPESSQGLSF